MPLYLKEIDSTGHYTLRRLTHQTKGHYIPLDTLQCYALLVICSKWNTPRPGVLAHSCNPSYREARSVEWFEM